MKAGCWCLTHVQPAFMHIVRLASSALRCRATCTGEKHAWLQALDSKLGTIQTDESHAKSFHDASDKVKFKAQVGPAWSQSIVASFQLKAAFNPLLC